MSKKKCIDSYIEEIKDRKCFIVDDTEGDFFVIHTHMYMFDDDEMKEHDNNIRKQVCDEIREKAKWSCPNDLKWTIRARDLDKIEKGE